MRSTTTTLPPQRPAPPRRSVSGSSKFLDQGETSGAEPHRISAHFQTPPKPRRRKRPRPSVPGGEEAHPVQDTAETTGQAAPKVRAQGNGQDNTKHTKNLV